MRKSSLYVRSLTLLALIVCSALSVFSQTLKPTNLTFAVQVINTTSGAQYITLTNTLSTALTISSIGVSGDFAEASNCPITPNSLAVGASCKIALTFTPTALGPRNGTLTVTDNAPNSPQTASLSGIGVAPVALIPNIAGFGNQFVNTTSAAKPIVLANYQNAALTITNIGITGDFAQTSNCPLSPATLAAKSSCTISVTFTPTASGLRTGTLTVTDNGPSSPQTAQLSGSGVLPVILSPATLSFPSQPIKTTSKPLVVSLKNNQSVPLTISGISASGDFAEMTNCPAPPNTLAAGATCGISVTFTPTAPGVRAGTLSVVDSASTSPQSVPLSGTGNLNGMASITVSPNNQSVPAGQNLQLSAIGVFPSGKTVIITNFVTWSSSATKIAQVNSAGLLQALAQGTATISASYGLVNGATSVNVTAPVLTSIIVTPGNPSIPVGSYQQFTGVLTYSDGSQKEETQLLNWSSSAMGVASVNSSGLATAAGAGSTTIQASSGGIVGSTTLTVSQSQCTVPPPGLVGWWTGDSNTVDLGGNNSGTLMNGASYGPGEVGQAFTFAGNGASVLVNAPVYSPTAGTLMFWLLPTGTGTMIGGNAGGQNRAPGFSVDTAGNLNWEFGDLFAQSLEQVSLNQWYHVALAYSVSNSEAAVTVYLNGAQVADAIAAPPSSWNPQILFGSYAGAEAPSFVGSMDEIAIFNQALGPQQIQQIYNAASAGMCKPTLQSIAVTPGNPSLPVGLPLQFDAVGTYSDNSTHDVTTSAAWSSSNTGVATVNLNGVASGVAAGQSTLTATLGSTFNSASLTVTPAALVSISINPPNPGVQVGGMQQFTATGMFSDGSQQDLTNTVTWSSSNASVAGINTTGLATGVATGATTISAALNSIGGSTTLSVTQPGATLVSISVTPSIVTIAIGQNVQLSATGQYSDGSTQNLTNSVVWSSTQTGVAGVSSAGLVSGVSGGSSTINATSGAIIGSATVNVNAFALISLTIAPANVSIAPGTNQQFAAIATYADGGTVDLTSSVAWSSTQSSVATINSTGLATAVAAGQSMITANVAGVVGSTALTVTSASLVSIVVTPVAPVIPQGTTAVFTATGTFSDGTVQNISTSVQWNSSNSSVAIVSNVGGMQGITTGLSQGTCSISASVGSVSGSASLTVSNLALVAITVNPAIPSIAMGTTQQFTATGALNDGSSLDVSGSVTWNSQNTGIATVSSTGLGTGVTVGSTPITASLGAVNGSAVLNVTPATIVSIAVNPGTATVPAGIAQAFTAQGTLSDGTNQDVTASAHWSSTTPAVATVSDSPGSSGLAAGVASGSTMISASLASATGTANLSVTAPALAAVEISPTNPTIPLGGTVQFTATSIYTDGTSANITNSVTWSSSSATVATVSNAAGSQGLATTVGSGSVRISATFGSQEGSTTLVIQDQLVSIALTPSSVLSPASSNLQFKAIGSYMSGLQADLTSTVLWTSSNPAVATISPLGLAMTLASGETTITASLASINASATLGVTPIQHVVVIFQENRSVDNLFQDPVLIGRGADIASNGLTSTGQIIPLQPGNLSINYDIPHSHVGFLLSSDNGKMDGFNLNLATCSPQPCTPPPHPQYFYINPSEVTPYFQMAEQYTFGDRMFQTNQGPSFPAHQYIISGTSAPTATSDLYAAENTIPFGANTGCTAAPNVSVALIDPTGSEAQTQYPCFEHQAITDLLDAQNISWRYYTPTGGTIWTGPNAIQHIRMGPDWNNVIIPQTQVLKDISNGKLSAVSWVIPSGQASDHPGVTDGSGPSWVASVVNAIGNGPYWSNTAIIVTWDDWGGWYDHVAPPVRNYYEYGFRVPLIVISPYAKANYISHVTHDFGSILRFIEETYNLPSLGYADSRADDLSDCFNFGQAPISFQTITAPIGPERFLNDTTPPTDPDDD